MKSRKVREPEMKIGKIVVILINVGLCGCG